MTAQTDPIQEFTFPVRITSDGAPPQTIYVHAADTREAWAAARAAHPHPAGIKVLDPSLQVACDWCGHAKDAHAFFPAADGSLGEPAELCIGSEDEPTCECEGFADPPVVV